MPGRVNNSFDSKIFSMAYQRVTQTLAAITQNCGSYLSGGKVLGRPQGLCNTEPTRKEIGMTIAIAALSDEGVVLGADSAVTIEVHNLNTSEQSSRVINHGQKIFELGPTGQSRMGVCTYGASKVGKLSHRTFLARVAETLAKEDTVAEAAEKIAESVKRERSENHAVTNFAYLIGGWDANPRQTHCLHIDCNPESQSNQDSDANQDTKPVITPITNGTIKFFGNGNYFSRLHHGFDPRLKFAFYKRLKSRYGANNSRFNDEFKSICAECQSDLQLHFIGPSSIRDLADYVHMLLQATIVSVKFSDEPRDCGGQTDVAAITLDNYFRWVYHKPLDSAIQERESVPLP